MKRPPDCRLIRLLRRFSSPAVQWFSIALFAAGIFGSDASGQTSPPDKNSARSVSGQFIVIRPAQSSPAVRLPGLAADTNLVRLDPALLTVSAERIKKKLWRQLEINGPWRGQIYVVLHPAKARDEGVTIVSQHFARGWNYRVEMPDVLAPTRFARALTGVLLLEFANRNASDRSAEIPPWLTEGLSQQLLAAGAPEFFLSTPDKIVNGLPVTRQQMTEHGLDPLANARRVLKNHPALTFDELSWPSGGQLSGEDDGVYRASAQLFVREVLKLKNGPVCLRAMLESLPQFLNWQLAFRSAFAADFPRPLDIEKWWALRVVDFSAHDPGPSWTLAVSREKLDDILSVPVEVRATSNSLPAYTETSLQAVIRNWDPARQAEILQTKLRDLGLAQFRVARPYAVLTAEYRHVIGNYLGERPARPPAISWAAHLYALLKRPGAARTVKQLDALDARRRNIEATVRPEPSVQPSLAPLKF